MQETPKAQVKMLVAKTTILTKRVSATSGETSQNIKSIARPEKTEVAKLKR